MTTFRDHAKQLQRTADDEMAKHDPDERMPFEISNLLWAVECHRYDADIIAALVTSLQEVVGWSPSIDALWSSRMLWLNGLDEAS